MISGNDLWTDIIKKVTLLRSAEERKKSLINRKMEIEEELELLEGASDLLLQVASDQQSTVIHFLNNIVTSGIQEIFGSGVVIEFREVTRANQRVIDVVEVKEGNESDIPDGVGGGLVQMVSLLVQLTLLYHLRGELRQVVVLDESLHHLAAIYVPAAAKVLRDISDRLGIQLIVITHQEELAEVADVVYGLEWDASGTKVKRVED